MRKYPLVLGDRVETLELGRSGRRLVNLLEDPEQVAGQFEVTRKILKNIDTEGVEFVRGWDKAAISVVVLTPFFMSLVFVGVWVGVFVHQGKDPQAVVQTAFTVASYIVTVGKSNSVSFNKKTAEDFPLTLTCRCFDHRACRVFG